MTPGFRTPKAAAKKDKINELDKFAENIKMGMQMMQMMLQNMDKSIRAFNADLNNTMSTVNDIQYRTLAMLKAKTFDEDILNKVASELKLDDYNKASAKDDLEKGLEPVDIIDENCFIVITSVTPEEAEDKGIFRAKLPVKESPSKAFQEAILGKGVGFKFDTTLNNVKHQVEILSISKKKVLEGEVITEVK